MLYYTAMYSKLRKTNNTKENYYSRDMSQMGVSADWNIRKIHKIRCQYTHYLDNQKLWLCLKSIQSGLFAIRLCDVTTIQVSGNAMENTRVSVSYLFYIIFILVILKFHWTFQKSHLFFLFFRCLFQVHDNQYGEIWRELETPLNILLG